MDNSRYLLRRFYDSFAVSSAFHHRSLSSSVSGESPHPSHKDERARRIKLKQSVTDPIPSLTKFHPPPGQDKRRVKAASAKFRQIGNHDSHQIKFENAWSSTRSRNMLFGFPDFVKQRFEATFVFYILRYD